MFKLVNDRSVPMTRELALDVATMLATPWERPVKDFRVQHLRSELDKGAFHPPLWVFAKVKENGKFFRVNGQHSSIMLSGLNGKFPKSLRATIHEYICDTMEDAAELFSKYDNPISSRTGSEIANAHGRAHDELAKMSPSDVGSIVLGIAGAGNEGSAPKAKDPADRARLIHSNIDFALFAHRFCRRRITSKTAVLAAIYHTWKRDPDFAATFWDEVRTASHRDPKHPSRTLNDFLKEGIHTQKWTARAVFVKCHHAWNAARQNPWRTTDLKYTKTAPVPKLA